MIANRTAWRSNGFRMGGGHEAYDAELTAVVYALVHFHERNEQGQNYTIFTDSVATMRRMRGDAPGPGQDMAIRAIEIAERLAQRDNSDDEMGAGACGSGRKREGRPGSKGCGVPSTTPGYVSTLQPGLSQEKDLRAGHPEVEQRHRGEECRTEELSVTHGYVTTRHTPPAKGSPQEHRG